ncbi:hypothetical protein [Acetobacter okinawensis]|uniref:Uncharacterized protein n=1 Tax=Acetobacter okinawensis TaxID=1076594 RepID=A0A252BXN1_9PROT|nr:hypothetical protein [Acetobacter okinawensis]OUJ13673.1 hypothetical protein HK26_07970 [Acetobacter okinawensis]
MRWMGAVVMAVAVVLGGHAGQAHAYQHTVHFRAQGDEATVAGTVEGEEVVQYKVPAKVGQFLLVGGNAKSARVSFWVRDPGGAEVYNSQIQNAAYVGRPERDGTYVVGVFLRKADAARGHAAFFRLRFLRKGLPEG